MTWELNFLEWLTRANANPSLDWLSWIFDIFTLACDKGLIWIIAAIIMLFFQKMEKNWFSAGFCSSSIRYVRQQHYCQIFFSETPSFRNGSNWSNSL